MKRAGDHDEDAATQGKDAYVVQVAGGPSDTAAKTVGHVVIDGAGSVDALRVLRHDPAQSKDADRGDEHGERCRGTGTFASRVQTHQQRNKEGDREDRSHESHRLGNDIDEAELLRSPETLDFLLSHRYLLGHTCAALCRTRPTPMIGD